MHLEGNIAVKYKGFELRRIKSDSDLRVRGEFQLRNVKSENNLISSAFSALEEIPVAGQKETPVFLRSASMEEEPGMFTIQEESLSKSLESTTPTESEIILPSTSWAGFEETKKRKRISDVTPDDVQLAKKARYAPSDEEALQFENLLPHYINQLRTIENDEAVNKVNDFYDYIDEAFKKHCQSLNLDDINSENIEQDFFVLNAYRFVSLLAEQSSRQCRRYAENICFFVVALSKRIPSLLDMQDSILAALYPAIINVFKVEFEKELERIMESGDIVYRLEDENMTVNFDTCFSQAILEKLVEYDSECISKFFDIDCFGTDIEWYDIFHDRLAYDLAKEYVSTNLPVKMAESLYERYVCKVSDYVRGLPPSALFRLSGYIGISYGNISEDYDVLNKVDMNEKCHLAGLKGHDITMKATVFEHQLETCRETIEQIRQEVIEDLLNRVRVKLEHLSSTLLESELKDKYVVPKMEVLMGRVIQGIDEEIANFLKET